MKDAKKIIEKCKSDGWEAFLASLDHRNTSSAGIQDSPAQRPFNRVKDRSLLSMKADLLVPQAVLLNEPCQAKLEQRKQGQATHYNRGAFDLDPFRRGDTERL